MLKKIISNGSNGVGIAALRAAVVCGLETGGTMRLDCRVGFEGYCDDGKFDEGLIAAYGLEKYVRPDDVSEGGASVLIHQKNDKAATGSLALQFFFHNPTRNWSKGDLPPFTTGEAPEWFQWCKGFPTDTGKMLVQENDEGGYRIINKAFQHLAKLPLLLAECESVFIHGSIECDEEKAEAWLVALFRAALTATDTTTTSANAGQGLAAAGLGEGAG